MYSNVSITISLHPQCEEKEMLHKYCGKGSHLAPSSAIKKSHNRVLTLHNNQDIKDKFKSYITNAVI